jgi:hypothetical protein
MCERLGPPITIGGRRKQKVDLRPHDWSQPDLSTIFRPVQLIYLMRRRRLGVRAQKSGVTCSVVIAILDMQPAPDIRIQALPA